MPDGIESAREGGVMARTLTPMMEQYMRFKEAHPDAILLFRMGDFYETFYDDAREVSRLLGLTLTTRNNGRAEEVPLAGVPHHALDTYLSRLIRAGRKVAICEQMEAPQKGKPVVHREVVQVVSPGTALTDDLLDQKRNNFLVGLFVERDRTGLVVTDLSTGVFQVSELDDEDLWDALERIGPAEVVAPNSWADAHEAACRDRLSGILVTRQEDWTFGYAYAYDMLLEHFRVSSLKGFGCEDLEAGVCAAGGVLCYLRENQKGAVSHITRMSREESRSHMVLDVVTQRNLELVTSIQEGRREGTLVSVLDQTCTAMGARALRGWLSRPLLDIAAIEARLDAVDDLVRHPAEREALRSVLGGIGDLERMMSRICCNRANPRDLVALKTSLRALPVLQEKLADAEAGLLAQARDGGIPDLAAQADAIENRIVDDPPANVADGGIIREGCHAELDELREVASGGRSWVARLQADERQRTGISSLKVGYNRAFGYYIEVTKANQDRVPESYVRKQTLVNAERYITPDLKDWEAKILGADERAKELEKALFADLREEAAGWVEAVQQAAETVAALDVLVSFAEAAASNDFVRPTVDDSAVLDVQDGRHPVVERLLPSGAFVANSLFLDGDSEQILIITGPNMAGKSTVLRQMGLIVLLAQSGSFVPARSARVGVVDRVFTRVGASDNLARGESTFLVEMNEAANILNNATPRSLVLLDEIGRGTSTFDGLSIAWAMTEYLHNAAGIRPRTLFATHYHELTDLEELLPRVRNYSVAVRKQGDRVAFLHRLIPGGCDRSYGIEVAQLAGMPAELIARAKEVLRELEKNELSLTRSGARLSRRSDGVSDGTQIPLFAIPAPVPSDHPAVKELRELDIEHTTPVEALMKLETLKRQIEEAEGEDGER